MYAFLPPTISTHKYYQRTTLLSFIFVIYFFFNSLFLPHGLLYTTALAPFIYLWLSMIRERFVISRFLMVALPIASFQLLLNTNVNYLFYFRSFLLYLLIFISAYGFFVLCKRVHPQRIARLFTQLIQLNFVFLILALIVKGTPLVDLLWTGWEVPQRLELLTYEPSYYSTLMVPLVVFAMYSFVFRMGRRYIVNLFLVCLPFAFSFSFGVIGALVIAFGFTYLFKIGELSRRPMVIVAIIISVIFSILVVSVENPIGSRLDAVLSGQDISGNHRFYQSNYVAWQIADKTSLIFGSGFGQAKVLAVEFFDVFWLGLKLDRLTNAVAGTLAEFGLIGIGLRFFLEMYLFYQSKVFRSPFRLTLFLFAFIYQFTGSYTTNLAEYVIWILAFVPIFYQFEGRKILKRGEPGDAVTANFQKYGRSL